MALPPAFLEELRARTPLPSLIGRNVRLSRSGRQWKGCCPFHGEKTPSFYVYDDHFHCFGCGAHGDAISYVMQGGADFMEAVRQLAGEAGLEVPREDRPERISEAPRVLEAAAAWFRAMLDQPGGAAARRYLRDRGVGEDSMERFGLGYADPAEGGLCAALRGRGFTEAQMEEAGLVRREEGRAARDFFFKRAMFPIRDRKGRVIGFGGRILEDAQPKYLNGPETPLFAKRRCLYGLDLARAGVRSGAAAIAVEGYLDVIALHQAGFSGAVAPLGTALTEEQLAELWRLSPEPLLCFDGDPAGRRAAKRALETALPLLTPERTLGVVLLDGGEDPDSLIRRDGAEEMARRLERKLPLAAALYDLARAEADLSTPEGRAGFRNTLAELAGRIGDKALAGEYRRELLDRDYAERRARRGKPGPARRSAASPMPSVRMVEDPHRTRLCLLLLIGLRHPALLRTLEEEWSRLVMPEPWDRLRDAMLDHAHASETLDVSSLINHLRDRGLESEARRVTMAAQTHPSPCCRAGATLAEAEEEWRHFFDLVMGKRLPDETAAAERDLVNDFSPAALARLIATAQLRLHGDLEDQ